MPVAECRAPGCANVGVYSCRNCGRSVCGRHRSTRYPGRRGGPWCQVCGDARRKRETEIARTGYRIAVVLLLLGGAILGITGLTDQGARGWYVLGGIIVALGVGAAFLSTGSVNARYRG